MANHQHGPTAFSATPEDEGRGMDSHSADMSVEPPRQPLFFADSEDENDSSETTRFPSMQQHDFLQDSVIEIDEDIEVPSLRQSPAASVSSASLPRSSSPADSVKSDEPPMKKRRLSSANHYALNVSDPMFIGSIIIHNAWSTTRGTGYVKSGDEIIIERDELEEEVPRQKPKGKGATKQLSISAMIKGQAAKPARRKQDFIVRLTNKRGFGKCWRHPFVGCCKSDTFTRIWSIAYRCRFLGLKINGL